MREVPSYRRMSPDEVYVLTDQNSGPTANLQRFVCWKETKRKSKRPSNINQFTDTHAHFQVVCRKARALLFLHHIEAHTALQNTNTSKSPSPLRPYENRFENTLTAMKHESNKRSPIPGFIMRAGSYGSTGNLLELGTRREKMSGHWRVSLS
jgi:hypothetical protein